MQTPANKCPRLRPRVAVGAAVAVIVAAVPTVGLAQPRGCLRHSLLIRQPICVRAATRTMTARLG